MGGTEKTPLILYLSQLLAEQGYKPGIVSSGYDGISELWPQWIDKQSSAEQVGYEALLMTKHIACPITVGSKIVEACHLLLEKSDCNLILVNDGLQQYSLHSDIEIAVIDGERRFGNGYMLPCGSLREPVDRLLKVDFVIVNGNNPEKNECSMTIEADSAINLITNELKSLKTFSHQSIHAIASIGNPKRFFGVLEREHISLDSHAFPDHYQFKRDDLSFKDDLPILMTEKDAIKCSEFAHEKCWLVPVTTKPQPLFVDNLIDLLQQKS